VSSTAVSVVEPVAALAVALGRERWPIAIGNRAKIKWICSSESCAWTETRALIPMPMFSVQLKNSRVADRRRTCERRNSIVCTITYDRLGRFAAQGRQTKQHR
jgi:hypothetical protein